MNDKTNRLQWEYDSAEDLKIEQLDEYGKEGWELISVVPITYEEDISLKYFFKKPVWESDNV